MGHRVSSLQPALCGQQRVLDISAPLRLRGHSSVPCLFCRCRRAAAPTQAAAAGSQGAAAAAGPAPAIRGRGAGGRGSSSCRAGGSWASTGGSSCAHNHGSCADLSGCPASQAGCWRPDCRHALAAAAQPSGSCRRPDSCALRAAPSCCPSWLAPAEAGGGCKRADSLSCCNHYDRLTDQRRSWEGLDRCSGELPARPPASPLACLPASLTAILRFSPPTSLCARICPCFPY